MEDQEMVPFIGVNFPAGTSKDGLVQRTKSLIEAEDEGDGWTAGNLEVSNSFLVP